MSALLACQREYYAASKMTKWWSGTHIHGGTHRPPEARQRHPWLLLGIRMKSMDPLSEPCFGALLNQIQNNSSERQIYFEWLLYLPVDSFAPLVLVPILFWVLLMYCHFIYLFILSAIMADVSFHVVLRQILAGSWKRRDPSVGIRTVRAFS